MEDSKLEALFEEFLLIYKVVNRKNIIDVLRSELNTEQLIEIYQYSNGERSTREVSAALKNKCSHSTIARIWNKWALLGLVVPAKQKGRYKAAFNLDEYGVSGVIEETEEK
ncbi:hypothetical protein [Ruthenibacterium lactatiformans]|uniref:hypothetical protein n=1 Tax=Oscillospiraceae TaxID=216572 RepID=UPI00210CA08D|nr:hypothetical protein [Ruthenibacterium lactatiformans]MCQ5087514.1 hypothetical protein [Ruthenibacterium lactatiformans]